MKAICYQRNKFKDKFPYFGLWCYMGKFGSGKTLTSVMQVKDICEEYPKCRLVTNTIIKGINNKTFLFQNADELVQIIMENVKENDEDGWIIFVDEIHAVLTDIFARGLGGETFLAYLSQLRKISMMIIGTSQLYNKCNKTIREYLRLNGNIVFCKKIFWAITINQFVDMETCEENSKNNLNYEIAKWSWYFHTIELYESYESFALVSQIKNLLKKEMKENGNQLPGNNQSICPDNRSMPTNGVDTGTM